MLGQISVHKSNLVGYASDELELDATKFDGFMGNASFVTGTFAFCALIGCSVFAEVSLSMAALWLLLTASYFTPVFAIFISWQYKIIAKTSLPNNKAIRSKIAPYRDLYCSEIQPKVKAISAARRTSLELFTSFD